VLVFEHCGLLYWKLVPGSGASMRERMTAIGISNNFLKDSLITIAISIDSQEQNTRIFGGGLNSLGAF